MTPHTVAKVKKKGFESRVLRTSHRHVALFSHNMDILLPLRRPKPHSNRCPPFTKGGAIQLNYTKRGIEHGRVELNAGHSDDGGTVARAGHPVVLQRPSKTPLDAPYAIALPPSSIRSLLLWSPVFESPIVQPIGSSSCRSVGARGANGAGAVFVNQLVKWDEKLKADLDKMLDKAKAANERRYFGPRMAVVLLPLLLRAPEKRRVEYGTKDDDYLPRLALPHLSVPDIRWVDWPALRRLGFRGVVFDKDNTLTAPYSLSLWPSLDPSFRLCHSAFPAGSIAVFSNSAGARISLVPSLFLLLFAAIHVA
ncbi:hypothetical protein BHE74_00032221 [Ensete ventricosum]|nr:hypothetical protein GW17_00034220 [Ensete ventricosum]RWW60762.1 hypothetical protein BHE74_00032221 [Ensete ventricosum]RZS03588.1 hypothetical protein BHM03_00033767 [Ensete ventricosum]